MINLEDIPGTSTIDKLKDYQGRNPYILTLKRDSFKNGFKLTDNQVKYIDQNFDTEPIKMDRVIKISSYLGEELQKKEGLSFQPEKILIEYLLADTEKTYHIWGKVKRNQVESRMYWLPKTQVLDDIYFEEVDIDVDFEKYQELDTLGRMPYEHQKSGIKFLLGRDGAILADDMGLGKSESVDNKVFTPFGRRRIGDLRPGDYVIGSNGKKTLVEAVYPQGKRDLYRVTFNDGYYVIVDKEHLWTVSSNNGSYNNKNRPIRYTTLSVGQMLDKDLVLEQKGFGWNEKRPYKFKTYYKQSNGQNKWQIPIVKPIQFENNYQLPINPYLLGLSLGDGHIQTKKVLFGVYKDDFDELFNDFNINEIKPFKNIRKGSIVIGESLKELKLDNTRSDTKFIPDIYKYSSIEDRIAILQGLMDTDGYCSNSKNGEFVSTEYCSVSERLVDDVAEIVHSLGGIVRKHKKIGSYKKEDGTKVMCKLAYRLNIKFSNGVNPFRLKRKANLFNQPQKYKVGRYIKNIEYERTDEAVCIQVDAKNHLYVTEHGIVTHNTYQAIIAALESGAEKILIVSPSSVKINWEREINAFCDHTAIVNGKKWKSNKFTIINYDILKNFHTLNDGKKVKTGRGDEEVVVEYNRHLVNEKFDLVIIDEAHKLKDPKSIRGKVMNDLCGKHGIKKVWLLTGTPIANRPMDYYNLLKLIKAPIADNWMFFAKRYCEGRKFFRTLKNGRKKQIWLTNGASNLNELHLKTKNNILRRLKEDVLDMPDKTIVTNFHELSKREWNQYDDLWDEYIDKRREEGKSVNLQRDLVELIILRKFIAMTAIDKTIEMAEDAIEQGHKVIIFTTFTDELEEISDHFGSSSVIHYGGMTEKAKQKSVDDFQNKDKVKVFVGNVISAGVGITLTAGDVVIFNSFSWVPGDFQQATDRSFRIGQKNNVTVYVQLFKDTVSTLMWGILEKKQNIIDEVIKAKKIDLDIIDDFMNDV